ncbi:MAG TPA: hypothetical protein VEW28_08600 [Candidatus Kapabacteria bacterium]|nr:hypothetical protein [Candidatus Kapabacteria bacterium]
MLVDSIFVNYTVNERNIHLADYCCGEALPSSILGFYADSVFSIRADDSIYFAVPNDKFDTCTCLLKSPCDTSFIRGTFPSSSLSRNAQFGSALVRLSDGSLWTTDSVHTGILHISKINPADSDPSPSGRLPIIRGFFSFTAIKIGAKSSADTIQVQNGVITNVEVDKF